MPYPNGWMDPKFSSNISKPKVVAQDVGINGIKGHGSPVIIFDDPSTPIKKARFSVLDPRKGDLLNRNVLQKPPGQIQQEQERPVAGPNRRPDP